MYNVALYFVDHLIFSVLLVSEVGGFVCIGYLVMVFKRSGGCMNSGLNIKCVLHVSNAGGFCLY